MNLQFWHKNVTQNDVEIAKNAYREAVKFPQIVEAKYDEINNIIESKWSQVDLADLSGKRSFLRITSLDSNSTSMPIPITETELTKTSNGIKARIVKKTSNTYLEIWKTANLEKSYNLTELDLHGPVYFDNQFGSLALDPIGQKVAFVAEKKRPNASPFFKPGGSNGSTLPGQEYNLYDDWGEQMTDKSQTVIVILNWSTDDFLVVQDLSPEYCHGNILWQDQETLIGTATKIGSYRLGIVYTTSKVGHLFRINVNDPINTYQVLSDDKADIICRSPRLSPDGKTLIWLERDLNKGTHACCLRLMGLDLGNADAKSRVVIQTVDKFEPGVDTFAGLYRSMLPEKCFLSNDDIIISEVVNDTLVPIICNIKSLDSIIVKNDYAYFTTTDVSENGKVIAVKSTPLETPSLWIGTYADGNLSFKCILEGINLRHHLPSDITFETLIHTPTEVHEDPEFKDVKYSSIYVGPTTSNWPLITWPHGGPHSVVTATFSNDILFYLKMGYGVLLPNYRGSLGAGQAGVLSLTAHVGNYDVKDCQQAVQDCLERFSSLSKDNLLLYGGSHGGSIVTHLAGQFPDDFKAVVARNPVINVSTKVMTCDNPDSGFNSTGIDFEYLSPEPEVMATMFYNSAISHVNNVKIPVHLNLGTLDRRVVKTQGIELYRNLKALGKDVSVNIYEDNHPLAKVSTHTNIFINTVLFFKSIIKKC